MSICRNCYNKCVCYTNRSRKRKEVAECLMYDPVKKDNPQTINVTLNLNIEGSDIENIVNQITAQLRNSIS